jgi:hypothetical protein
MEISGERLEWVASGEEGTEDSGMYARVLATLLPVVLLVAALVVPSVPGMPVGPQASSAVVGAAPCFYQLTTTHPTCDPPNTHSICIFGSYGSGTTWDLQQTNQIASDLVYPRCPCSAPVNYAKGGGACTGGYY